MNAPLREGSAGQCDAVSNIKGNENMLARRFTIVCLLATLFGIGFAMIVAENGRQPRHWEQVRAGKCLFGCTSISR